MNRDIDITVNLKLFYVLRDNGLSSNVFIKLVHRGLLDDMCDLFLNTNCQ